MLCFEKSVDVHRYIRLGEVLAVQTAAGDGVRHVGAELAVRRTSVHIGAARPVAQRVDFNIRVHGTEFVCRSVALADDEPVTVEDVLAVAWVCSKNASGNA